MNISMVASFIIFFLIIFIFVNAKFCDESSETVSEPVYENGDELIDEADNEVSEQQFDDEYFERCRKGEGRQLFCNFASWQDCSIFQGILFANGIPSHKEHENSNRFYFGSNALSNVFAVQLWILINDYNDAYELLRYFTKQKTEAINENSESESNNVGKKLLGIVLSPVPVSKEQEILGIKVFPKFE